MTAPTKTPIDPSEIRKGDRVRVEFEKTTIDGFSAIEYVAEHDGEHYDADRHYLLDRPKRLLYPAGTKLWLTREFYPWAAGDQIELKRDWFEGDDGVTTDGQPLSMIVSLDAVTDVSPRTAVPTDALDKLRAYIDSWIEGDQFNTPAKRRIKAFLAAVDEATS